MPHPLGVDFTNICARVRPIFSRAQKEKPFLAHGVWRKANEFGEKRTIFSLKFRVSIVGEIEWHIFCQTPCAGVFSLGAQSLVKSTPDIFCG